jgi:GntR family transcriptional regulator
MSVANAKRIFKSQWRPQHQAMAKYAQLVHVIEASVAADSLSPGNKLPTETEFVNGTPFSLGTVQRAMRILVDREVIERRQGVGTFVLERTSRLNEPQQIRAFDDNWEEFLEIFTKLIGRTEITDKGPWTRHLGNELEKVFRIERILDVGGEFKVVSRFYFDPMRLPSLVKIPHRKLAGANFKDLIDHECGLAVKKFVHNLRVEAFDESTSKLVDCVNNTTGTVLEAIALSDMQITLYFQELYIPPNGRTLLISGDKESSLA